MSQAKPVSIKSNKSGQVFAKIKNGNIYRLNANTTPEQATAVISRIKDAGKISLKHWTRVEKHEPLPVTQCSEPTLVEQYNAVWNKRVDSAAAEGNVDKLKAMYNRKKSKLILLSGKHNPKNPDPRLLAVIQAVTNEQNYAASKLQEAGRTPRIFTPTEPYQTPTSITAEGATA